MAKCFNCGTEYEGKFCPDCGSPNAETIPQPEPMYSDQPQPQTPFQQQYQQQRYAQPPMYNGIYNKSANVTSTLGWVGWLLLVSILPVIGLIIMLCVSNDESAKNFAKAQFIFMLIGVAIVVLLVSLFAAADSSFY